MHYTRFIKTFIKILILTIIAVIAINLIIDPFQIFRKSTLYKVEYLGGDERYLNAGLIKSYDFNSIAIGSSLSENFSNNDISQYLKFNRPIKLCISGSSSYEVYLTLKASLKKNPEKILYSINPFMLFSGSEKRLRYGEGSFPDYLYKDENWPFFKYLFNLRTFKKSLAYAYKQLLLEEKNLNTQNFDSMYSWYSKYQDRFTHNNLIDSYKKFKNNPEMNKLDYQLPNLKKNYHNNLESIVKNNNHVKFVFFYPPKSILFFKSLDHNGYLDTYLLLKEYISNDLLKYKNVEIHDLQISSDITHTLSNYMDYSHYNASINKRILRNISLKNTLVNRENNNKFIELLRKQTVNFKLP